MSQKNLVDISDVPDLPGAEDSSNLSEVPDLSDMIQRSATLPLEWAKRKNAINANVARLASQIPVNQYAIRVKTQTAREPLHPLSAVLILMALYGVLGVPILHLFVENGTRIAAGGILPFSVIAFILAFKYQDKLVRSSPRCDTLTVNIHDGKLAIYQYRNHNYEWHVLTCMELIEEEGVQLGSLLVELEKAILFHSAKLDVLDAQIDVIQSAQNRLREQAAIMAEVNLR